MHVTSKLIFDQTCLMKNLQSKRSASQNIATVKFLFIYLHFSNKQFTVIWT